MTRATIELAPICLARQIFLIDEISQRRNSTVSLKILFLFCDTTAVTAFGSFRRVEVSFPLETLQVVARKLLK